MSFSTLILESKRSHQNATAFCNQRETGWDAVLCEVPLGQRLAIGQANAQHRCFIFIVAYRYEGARAVGSNHEVLDLSVELLPEWKRGQRVQVGVIELDTVVGGYGDDARCG